MEAEGLCGLCVPPSRKKWVRRVEVSVQGGLGKLLGYGSPRGWNGGMPVLLHYIDIDYCCGYVVEGSLVGL